MKDLKRFPYKKSSKMMEGGFGSPEPTSLQQIAVNYSYTIPLTNIIQDSQTLKWLKTTCPAQTRIIQPKGPLPGEGFTTPLRKDKLDAISQAYQQGQQYYLPNIKIKQYKSTNYYQIMDGRHRVAAAICAGRDSIQAEIVT